MEITPQKLIELRNKKGLSQQEIADYVGVSQVSYSMWESGKTKPKYDSVVKLLELLGDADKKTYKTIPLYEDVGSVGGTTMVAEDAPAYNPTGVIDVGDLFPGATAAIRHYNDSMQEYPSGCILALQDQPQPYSFMWGQNYVIETGYFRITKKVQRGKTKAEIRAYSTNRETYPDGTQIHEPIDIPIQDIRRLFLVLGHIVRSYSSGALLAKRR